MLLGDLISFLPLRPIAGVNPAIRVCDLTEDSRTVVPGSLFIARPGGTADGRRYITDAINAGAVAIVVQADATTATHTTNPSASAASSYLADISGVALLEAPDAALAGALLAERFYRNPSAHLALVGITGTNGKSTTAHIIHRTLNALHHRTGLIGTVEIDDGVCVAPAEMTTPPATEISRTLACMVEQGCLAAAMEVSSHALDQHRAAALSFMAAVFTNLTRDHLNYHKTMEAYASAKRRLFDMLLADGVAIVNAHDPAWSDMVRTTKANVLRCVQSSENAADALPAHDASVRILAHTLAGMSLELTGPWGVVAISSPLIGHHNAMNLLQAAASMWAIGIPAPRWSAALASVGPPAGRLERVTSATDQVAVFVDYAHTPDAIENVLTAVRAVAGTRPVTIVFGAGGDKDRGKRSIMGEISARLADRVVVTSDNPRSERPGAIINQIMEGIPAGAKDRVEVHVDRERAIHAAITQATIGEIIVIAGKGHETQQVSVDEQGRPVSRHFDDREVARAALAARHAGVSSNA